MTNVTNNSIPRTSPAPGGYGRTAACEFDGIGHAVAVAKMLGRCNDPRSVKRTDEVATRKASDWTNEHSIATVEAALRRPSPALLQRVAEMRGRIESLVEMPTRNRRKLRRNREEGEELDPVAVLHRRLDGWTETEHARVPKPFVTVAVNMTVNSNRTSDQLLYRGAAAAAVADVFTASGHSVEVVGFVAVSGASDRCDDLMIKTVLKPADAPMDIGALATACAEIGFFRCVMIPCIGRTTPGEVGWGFGQPRTMRPDEVRGVDALIDGNVLSESAAVDAVRRAMATLAGREEGIREQHGYDYAK